MKTYKTIKHLEKRAKENNGKPVIIWDDEGIKVLGIKYFLFEYGNMQGNKGDCYCTFRNTGKRKHKGLNEPIGEKDQFITIEYNLLKNPAENTNNIFNFRLLREDW